MAFEAISGNYFLRINGLIYAFRHINGLIAKIQGKILDQYRKGMTEAERRSSVKVQRRFQRQVMRYTMPQMSNLFNPFFDPAKYAVPTSIDPVLARIAPNQPLTAAAS